jgi:hypothetical protein
MSMASNLPAGRLGPLEGVTCVSLETGSVQLSSRPPARCGLPGHCLLQSSGRPETDRKEVVICFHRSHVVLLN